MERIWTEYGHRRTLMGEVWTQVGLFYTKQYGVQRQDTQSGEFYL